MRRMNLRAFAFRTLRLLVLLALVHEMGTPAVAAASSGGGAFPRPFESYADAALGVGAKLIGRAHQEPFNLLATVLFLGAIIHTFLASRFMAIAHRYQHELEILGEGTGDAEAREAHGRVRDRLRFRAQLFHFMGEIEAVFGIWVVPLGLALVVWKGWPVMVAYVWGWGLSFMFIHFGLKAGLGILVANSLPFLVLRRRFALLAVGAVPVSAATNPAPLTVTLVHLFFIGWTVLTSHYPPLV